MTHALRALESHRVAYICHEYRYVAHGGTAEPARQLGVDEHLIVKTLVFGETSRHAVLVLMHGDAEVSVKELARIVGVKSIAPSSEAVAERVTGCQVGGISPFGTRQSLPVYVEGSILELPRVYINGGRRGLLVSLAPEAMRACLDATPVNVRA